MKELYFKNIVLYICIIGVFVINYSAIAGHLRAGAGLGYERISEVQPSQNGNLFIKINLAKEFIVNTSKLKELYLGLEVDGQTGFYGELNISDEIQENIGGPTPMIYSGSEIEFLTTTRKYIGNSKIYVLAKLGVDFSIIKFDRSDFNGGNIINIIAYTGLGTKLSKQTEVNINISSSKPTTMIHFAAPKNSYSMYNPYSQIAIFVNFIRAF